MTGLLLLAALFGLGMAASSKASASSLPAPSPKKSTSISIIKPRKKKRRVITKRASARRAKVNKLADKLALKIAPATPKARKLVSNMIKTASSRTAHPVLKSAAKKQLKTIIAKPMNVRLATINKLPQQAKIQIAKAIIKADSTTKPTPDQAAKALQLWTKNGGNQGTKNNRSEMVKKSQALMGLSADGIIGPNTRARAKSLGFTLYPRSYQKAGAVGGMR